MGVRNRKRAAIALATLFVAPVLFTAWALEGGGVAVVTTQGPVGPRETHVWYARDQGQWLLEAGTPENPWFVDLGRDPHLQLKAPDASGRFRAEPLPNPEGHEHVRRLLRAKYGVRDAWIALLFDTDRSVAVALSPEAPDR